MAVNSIFFASPDVMLTSKCVTGTNCIVSTGAVSCYPAPMEKTLVHSWQIVEVLQLQYLIQLQKQCKAIAFTCLRG